MRQARAFNTSRDDCYNDCSSDASPRACAGVSPCYRGKRLYDEAVPASKALVQKYTAFNARYRTILHADVVHLRRPHGRGYDALLHVEPDRSKCKERALLVVFNQHATPLVNVSLRVPLYYAGVDDVTSVSRMGAPPVRMRLGRDWSVDLRASLPAASVVWWVFE